jgi:hypothetical protein
MALLRMVELGLKELLLRPPPHRGVWRDRS